MTYVFGIKEEENFKAKFVTLPLESKIKIVEFIEKTYKVAVYPTQYATMKRIIAWCYGEILIEETI